MRQLFLLLSMLLRRSSSALAFPPNLRLTFCSFNRRLIRQRGLFMGFEHRAKGVNVVLGPMMNLGRVAQVRQSHRAVKVCC
jgi:beta-glucosidase-like glycosyl hydrolase